MLDLNSTIRAALIADSALTTILGGQRVYYMQTKKPTEFPRIIFFMLSNVPVAGGDNKEVLSSITYQISIFSKTESALPTAAARVNAVLTVLGFNRELDRDLADEEPDVFHRAMQFNIVKGV